MYYINQPLRMLLINRKYITNLIYLVCLIIPTTLSAQSVQGIEEIIEVDEAILPITDSLAVDSVIIEPTPANNSSTTLQDVVNYEAKDSLVFTGNNQAFLFGESVVTYQDIKLDAEEIKMSLDSSLVYANGVPDSTGRLKGLPVFTDKSGEYNSKTIKYSFETQKGYITDIVTEQGEGYVTSGKTKKMDADVFYMEDARYTTCDHHDCPHFYLHLTKAKVTPGKNIVTGPAYLVVADVPLPIAVPFGFFPFTNKYSSGIIMPTYGDELRRGFYLRDGGYYFALSDYMDLALTGEIFTKGSWGLNAKSNYAKRYKFNGNFNIGYQVTITGDKGLPDYSKMKNFRLTWAHSQDQKANPNMSFSASVNFTTSGYDRNNLDSYYNPDQFTENTKSSSVNMTYNFPNAPFSLSTTFNITQRSSDSTLAVSLPDLTLNMRRIYPFKRKKVVGKERWYEKITMGYTGLLRNQITTKQDQFFKSSLVKDWRNGMQHTIPISTTFNLFNYINVSPSINFVDRMYSRKVNQSWDPELTNSNGDIVGGAVRDTTYGFYNVYNFNASLSANTKLYGFYKPLPFLGDKVEMIRHVFTPSLSFSAQPDFSKEFWGFWDSYQQPDNTQMEGYRDVFYSPYQDGIFGTAPRGKSGTLSFNMTNQIEAKIKSNRDTTGVRKISLIDNLTAGISYNFAADSLRWSDIPVSLRLKLSKQFTLQVQSTLDTYTYNSAGRKIDVPRWSVGKMPRLKNASTSFGYTLNNDVIKKWFGQGGGKKSEPEKGAEEGDTTTDNALAGATKKDESGNGQFDSDGYQKWTVPWSLNINYGLRYGYSSTFDTQKQEFKREITQNLSFSGNISVSKNWALNFTSSYDFDLKKIAYMNCNISRDMHCWTMSAGVVPLGPYASYNVNIRVKSSLLSDLKYDKRSNPSSQIQWY